MDQIHCFILNPNDAFDPSQPASKYNLPYVLSLEHTQTIVSPILPGTMIDMSIGSHGTIIYMDSDIDDDDIPMSAGQGQRVAGNRIDASTGNKDTILYTKEFSKYYSTKQEEWTCVALQEDKGTIAIGHVDGRIMVFDYAQMVWFELIC